MLRWLPKTPRLQAAARLHTAMNRKSRAVRRHPGSTKPPAISPGFDRYIALGDSMSIDLYPALDIAGMNGRLDPGNLRSGLGAASLLYRNDDQLWPEFRGRDLSSLAPRCVFRNHHAYSAPSRYPSDNLTADGATTADMMTTQILKIEPSEEEVLVTVTAGGNDMLEVLYSEEPPAGLVDGMIIRLARALRQLRAKLPRSTVLVATVYDPSDGTYDLGGGRLDVQAGWLYEYNAAVRDIARTTPRVRLVDVHDHFLGHGITQPAAQRWYWRGLIFEPNARGASEIRRLWLQTLGAESE